MGAVLVLLGFAALIISLVALVKGRLGWARIQDRRTGAKVLGGSLAALLVGGLLTPASATSPAVPASSVPPTTSSPTP